jgi:hypothetical protein
MCYIPGGKHNKDKQQGEERTRNKVLDAYLGKMKRSKTQYVNKQSVLSATSLVSFRDCDRNTGIGVDINSQGAETTIANDSTAQNRRGHRASGFSLGSGGSAIGWGLLQRR